MHSDLKTAATCVALATLFCGCGRAHPVSSPGQPAFEVSLASLGDQLVAAWQGGQGAHEGIYLRLTDPSGHAVGVPVRLTDQSREAFEPDVQLLDDEIVVAWYEKDRQDGSLSALVAQFNVRGELQWRRALSGPYSNGRNPVVRVFDSQIDIAWIETPGSGETAIWYASLRSDGEVIDQARRIATASQDTWNLNAAIDHAGVLHVVYDARVGTRAKELLLVRTDGNTTTQYSLSADDGYDSNYPDLSLQGDHAAVTWFDRRDGNDEIYLFTGRIQDLVTAIDTRAFRVTHTPGPSIGAYVAWNGTRIGLAWCDASGGQNEIYSQSFDEQGLPLQAARQLTRTPAQSLIPAIRPWRKGFAIAWNEFMPASDARSPEPASAATSTAMLELIP